MREKKKGNNIVVYVVIGCVAFFVISTIAYNLRSEPETIKAEKLPPETEEESAPEEISIEKTEPLPDIPAELPKETAQEDSSEPSIDDSMSTSQKNAVKSAIQYLNYSAYSRQGLIRQLSSEYGDSFPEEDATFAVDYLEQNNSVDWNEQAVKCAQQYLDYSAYSKKGLAAQLSGEYGDQFTPDQAEYAVNYLDDNNLVDWNEQAAKAAKQYLDYSSYSRDGLIQQLTSEYGDQYTTEQAEYGVDSAGL